MTRFAVRAVLLGALQMASLLANPGIREYVLRPTFASGFTGEIGNLPGGEVRARGRAGQEDSRAVMEFALPDLEEGESIVRASFSIETIGWGSGSYPLEYGLFSYPGNGRPDGTDGLAGNLLAGPFTVENQRVKDHLKRVDARAAVEQALLAGQGHLGFAIRPTRTVPNSFSSSVSFVLGPIPAFGLLDNSPFLIVQVGPTEPDASPAAAKTSGTKIVKMPRTKAADSLNSSLPVVPHLFPLPGDGEGPSPGFLDGTGKLATQNQINPASFAQLNVLDGDYSASLGSGQSLDQPIDLENTGAQTAGWRFIWEIDEDDYQVERAAKNIIRSENFHLSTVPVRHPFDLVSGQQIESGIFLHNGARLFLDNIRLPYTGGDLVEVETNQGTARYLTRHTGDFFATLVEFEGCDTFNSAGDLRLSDRSVEEFELLSQNGIRYRGYANFGSNPQENVVGGCQIFLLPDSPDLGIRAAPFIVSNLPESGHLYYLLLAKPENQAFSLSEVKTLSSRFLMASENGPGWVSGHPPAGATAGNSSQTLDLSIDTFGLPVDTFTQRYAIAPLTAVQSEVPESAWNTIAITIDEPDFAVESPVISTAIPAGGLESIVPIQIISREGSEFVPTNLAASEPWVEVRQSTSDPNLVEVDINGSQRPPGEYRIFVTIETADTRDIVTLDLSLELQSIQAMEADPFRNRIYALNVFSEPGLSRNAILVYEGGAVGWSASIPVGEFARDLTLSQDGSTLSVGGTNGELWHFDTTFLERKSVTDLNELLGNYRDVYLKVESGPGSTVIVNSRTISDSHVIDYERNRLTRFPGISGSGNLYYHKARDEFFMLRSFSLEKFTRGENAFIRQEIVDTRDLDLDALIFSRDGFRLFGEEYLFDVNDLSATKRRFDERIFETNASGSIAVSRRKIFDANTTEVLVEFEGEGPMKVTPDSRFLYYFNSTTRAIEALDLTSLVGGEKIGLGLSPGDGETISFPEVLRWSPPTEATTFNIYLAEDSPNFDDQPLTTTSNFWTPLDSLMPNQLYFWRVDSLGPGGEVVASETSSFRTSSFGFGTPELRFIGLENLDGLVEEVELEAGDGEPWSISVDQPWLSVEPSSGIGPAQVSLLFNASSLPAGSYRAALTVAGEPHQTEARVEVVFDTVQMEVRQTFADPGSRFVFFRSRNRNFPLVDHYLRFNMAKERYDLVRSIPTPLNPTFAKLILHPEDRRIYALSSSGPEVFVDTISLPDLRRERKSELLFTADRNISLTSLGVSPGPPGILLTGEEEGRLFDLNNLEVLPLTKGGEPFLTNYGLAYDPDGGFLYSGELQPEFGTTLVKYNLVGNEVSEIARADFFPTQTTQIQISPDGGTLVWKGQIYNDQLEAIATLPRTDLELNDFTPGGELGFDRFTIYNLSNGLEVGPLAERSNLQAAYDDPSRMVFQFRPDRPEFFKTNLATLTTFGGTAAVPAISDGSIIFNNGIPLSWEPDAKSLAYRIYLGTDANAVAEATPNSVEFIGETGTTSISPPAPFEPDQNYFWRIDRIGFTSESKGSVLSFQASSISASPANFHLESPWKVPVRQQEIQLQSESPVSWTATSDTPWIEILTESGTSPGTVRFELNITGLERQEHTGSITLSDGSASWDYPVTVDIVPVAIQSAFYDGGQDRIIALSQDRDVFDPRRNLPPGYLIAYNGETGEPLRATAVGKALEEFHIDEIGDRILVGNPEGNQIRILSRDTLELVDLITENSAASGEPDAAPLGLGFLSGGPNDSLLTVGGYPGTLKRIASETGRVEASYRPIPYALQDGPVSFDPQSGTALHFSRRGRESVLRQFSFSNGITQTAEATIPSTSSALKILKTSDGETIIAGQGVFTRDLAVIGELPNVAQALTHDDRFVISGNGLIDINTRERVAEFDLGRPIITYASRHDLIWELPANGSALIPYRIDDLLRLPADRPLSPLLADNARVGATLDALSWERDLLVREYEIYLGTDRSLVEAGDESTLLGTTRSGEIAIPFALLRGQNYFWKIDRKGYENDLDGSVLRFSTRTLDVSPLALEAESLEIFPPATLEIQTSSGESSLPWTATSPDPWIQILTPSGLTPEAVRFRVLAEDLQVPSSSQGTVTIQSGSETITVPVQFIRKALLHERTVADPNEPKLYSLSSGYFDISRPLSSHLLVTDAQDMSVLNSRHLGDTLFHSMAVSIPDRLIYLAGKHFAGIRVHDLDTLELVRVIPLEDDPTGIQGITRVIPGQPGRLFLLENSSFSRVHLLDLESERILDSSLIDGGEHYWLLEPEMEATTDETGRWLYLSGSSDLPVFGSGNPFNPPRDSRVIRFDSQGDFLCANRSFSAPTRQFKQSPVIRIPGEANVFWQDQLLDPDLGPTGTFYPPSDNNGSIQASSVSPDGSTLVLRDRGDSLYLFDRSNGADLFMTQAIRRSRETFSPSTGRLYDTPFSSFGFTPPLTPTTAPPEVRWMQDLDSPWEASVESPGMVTADSNGKWMSFHVPFPAKVSFDWMIERPANLTRGIRLAVNGQFQILEAEAGNWQTFEVDLPEDGGHIAWQSFSFSESLEVRVRNLSILRRGGSSPEIYPDPDPGILLDARDTDGDGYSNLIEWLAGGDRARAGVVPFSRLITGSGEFRYQFKRRLDRGKMELMPELSSDLQTWEAMGFPQVRQIDIDGVYETLELTIPDRGEATFIRLRATSR